MAEEKDLGRLFEELRRADAASAPSFRGVLGRRKIRRAVSRPLLRIFAGAALAIAGALTAILLLPPGRRRPELDPAATIARWESPTDWLLRTPGRELLEELPALAEEVPSTRLPEAAGGTERETPTAARGRRP
jgi:hypothetical protein